MTKEDNLMFDQGEASFSSARILNKEMQLLKYGKVF